MASSIKKSEVKLESLTDIHILLMVQKGNRGGICHIIYQYANPNNKYIKDYDKNKESYLKACVCYFLKKFYVSLNDSPSKTMKDVFISSKKLFSFEINKFLYFHLPLFFFQLPLL